MDLNSQIFCNTPWYELHIYQDGSLGICCQESHKLYTGDEYNVATMTLKQWFNSDPVKKFRQQIIGSTPVSACTRCYVEEQYNGISRRHRSNQKSVIFTQAFDASIKQSPGYHEFIHSSQTYGHTNTVPIDLHIDLGNFCNLACKMCNAQSSSTIASQHVQWGIESDRQYVGTDWTKNQQVWNNFKQQLLELPGLINIHFMGGETLLTPRFEDLIDTMIEHKRFDLCFSFVTNGTVFRPQLIKKLLKFRRVGIEISIESVSPHNSYQRQGTNTEEVLTNINQYQTYTNGSNITVSVRPAPSILTIGYYDSLLEYCLQHKLIVKSNLCYNPNFLDPRILPYYIKQQYLKKYQTLLDNTEWNIASKDFNASDPNNYKHIIKFQIDLCIGLLESPTPKNSNELLGLMVNHCKRWDQVYNYNARDLYPEWQEIFDQYGY